MSGRWRPGDLVTVEYPGYRATKRVQAAERQDDGSTVYTLTDPEPIAAGYMALPDE